MLRFCIGEWCVHVTDAHASAPGNASSWPAACCTCSGLHKSNVERPNLMHETPTASACPPVIESPEHANSKSVLFPKSVFMRLCFARSTLDCTNASSIVDATRLINAGSDSPGGIPALNGSCPSASWTGSSVASPSWSLTPHSSTPALATSVTGKGVCGAIDLGLTGVLVPEAILSARINVLKRAQQMGLWTLCSEEKAHALEPGVAPYLMILSRVMYSFLGINLWFLGYARKWDIQRRYVLKLCITKVGQGSLGRRLQMVTRFLFLRQKVSLLGQQLRGCNRSLDSWPYCNPNVINILERFGSRIKTPITKQTRFWWCIELPLWSGSTL